MRQGRTLGVHFLVRELAGVRVKASMLLYVV